MRKGEDKWSERDSESINQGALMGFAMGWGDS